MVWLAAMAIAAITVMRQCHAFTTPMTIAMTYPDHNQTPKALAAVGITTVCPIDLYPVYATSTEVPGAPALQEVCWRGAFTSTFPYIATIGKPVSFDSVSDAYTLISALCGTIPALPAYIFATTTTTQSVILVPNGALIDIFGPNESVLSQFVCQRETIGVPLVCGLPGAGPGSAYAAVALQSLVPLSDFSTICNSALTTDPFVTGTFVKFETHPMSYTIAASLFAACTDVGFLPLNQQAPINNLDSLVALDSAPFAPITIAQTAPVFYAICSFAARPCTTQLSGWFLGSIYPGLADESPLWTSLCSGQISGGYYGVFQAPGTQDQPVIDQILSVCPFGTSSILTSRFFTVGSTYNYGWCSYTPLNFFDTPPTTTITQFVTTTTTTTRFQTTAIQSDSFTEFSFSTTFLVTSTSITTTSTTTVVQTSRSTSTTSTTTTTTSTRILSDSTTSTTTLSLTFTVSVTTKSTGSFTETVKTTGQTTVTRTIVRTSCEPSLTTTTFTTSDIVTLTETDVETVYVDVTVYSTISKSPPTPTCPQSTKTRYTCSTSTQTVCKTSVVFSKPGDSNCPTIQAVVCEQGPSGIWMLFNNYPYSKASACPCQAVGKSMLVLKEDQDYLDAYAAVNKCGGAFGRAWVAVSQDYTRCYVASGEGQVVPAVTCDEPLPVLCR